ncbi:MAG: protein-tyrosine-phosphatase [Spirosomaceae bacterium]|nr:protein-tyrosine-phosphatase [Spirosomataceae bacterium]
MIYPEISRYISSLNSSSLPAERKLILQNLIDFVAAKITDNQFVNMNFICTHNSRRSHLSQVWAQAMAAYFQTKNVRCYSGGTEATAMFPKVVETLEHVGFKIGKISEDANPIYAIKFGENELPIIGFSKRFDADFNPKSRFAAVMTCSHADENCPVVLGAEKRIPITYEDPKISDNTPQQNEVYGKRSRQIATEMFYVFSEIKNAEVLANNY